MRRPLLFVPLCVFALAFLCSCGTTGGPGMVRRLPPFEPPIAKADFQTVRTTAYTHTEADHVEYGNRNALGGELRAASSPNRRAEYIPRALPLTADATVEYQFASSAKRLSTDSDDDEAEPAPKAKPVKKAQAVKSAKKENTGTKEKSGKKSKLAKKETAEKKVKRAVAVEKTVKGAKRAIAVKKPKPPVIGSAAADWARWPVGTTFRVLSTGQMYRVDDTGWALAGRNTIDLYMASRRDMNAWGTRAEKIQVLQWGDPEESARLLASRQDYKHARRMLLELSGRYDEAAQLE